MRYVEEYWEQGFAVVPGVFAAADVSALAAAFDAVYRSGARHPATFRHGNILYVVTRDPHLGPVVRFVQWPAYFNPVLARYRADPRLLRLLEPLIGRDLKQLTNTINWKRPGTSDGGFAYHQDSRFRRPASAFRNLGTSIVQSAIAIDPHRRDNGCMRICTGAHRRGDLRLGITHSVFGAPCRESDLEAAGLDPASLVDILLEPGDVVLWHPYAVHGSHPNASTDERRAYLNAYGIASQCDRGAWAFRDGLPCELGEPVLIQYDALFERPEPHYVEGPPHPYIPE
jgi:hypothetical protein